MNDYLNLVPGLLAGIILGAIFFGGLWLTIQKTLHSKLAGLWFVLSFITRMGITLAGFYLVSHDSWQKMLICLSGFLIARVLVIRITGKYQQSLIKINKESTS